MVPVIGVLIGVSVAHRCVFRVNSVKEVMVVLTIITVFYVLVNTQSCYNLL